jgi:glycosyltransferase involved in cell wall biosynthesis
VESTGFEYEIIFIDDGSHDATARILSDFAQRYPNIRVLMLSRNFGKEAAMTAGFAYSTGDAVIPMDCDLQDPPELIHQMIEKWRTGYKVVYAVRRSRTTDSRVKRITAKAFYRLMEVISDAKIPMNCGDYRLMDRCVVQAILTFPERNRFMKGIMAAAGFKFAAVEYDRPERVSGKPKFGFRKLWNLALDGITGFSTLPLRIWIYVGTTIALLSFFYASWIIFMTIVFGKSTSGFASLVCFILFLGGVQLIGIGVLGEYIGRIFLENKQRPLYLVETTYGFAKAEKQHHGNAEQDLNCAKE